MSLSPIRSFLGALLRRRRLEREIDQELEHHLVSRADDLRARGMAPEDAQRVARREFGDLLRWKEQAREAVGVAWVDACRADVRYGLRWLRRSPAFAATAVLSLAIGIGANAAIFSLLDTVLLQALPVHHPQDLTVFSAQAAGQDPSHAFSYNSFQTFQRECRLLTDTAAFAPLPITADVDGSVTPMVSGLLVSGSYFHVLGVQAILGRTLLPEDSARPGAGAVAMIGHAYWQRQFGGDPRVIGRLIRLNGQPFTIVGVWPREFLGTDVGAPAEIAVPLSMQLQVSSDAATSFITGDGADDFWLTVIGRRRPGASLAQATSEANGIYQRLLPEIVARHGPKAAGLTHSRLVLEPGSRGLSELRRRFSRPLLVLMAVVAMVLLIACANVANLLLARAASRGHEIAVRVSLGATRGRLIRQLLTESLLLALLGGAAGLLLAFWSHGALAGLLLDADSLSAGPGIEWRVLVFTLIIAVATGLLFGVIPALGAWRLGSADALKTGGRQLTAAGWRAGTRGWLVAAQVAVSIVLLIGASLFVRTLVNLRRIDLGFEREHVLSLRLQPHGSNQKRPNEARLRQQYSSVLERVRAVPGVLSASLAGTTPLSNENPFGAVLSIQGYAPRAGEDMRVRFMQLFPDYFSTLGVHLLAGRDLTAADNQPDGFPALVVNESFTRRYFDSPDAAIGRRVEVTTWWTAEIVGVVRDVRDRAVREPVAPLAYAAFAQAPTGRGQMTLLVRTAGNTSAIAAAMRDVAHAMDPAMPIMTVQTLADRVDAATRQEQLVAALSTIFGGLALALSAVGLYGVMAYAVARRQAEFGIRIAFGAAPGRLRRQVLRESLTIVVAGLAIGIAAAALGARLIAQMLFGLPAVDVVSYAAACLVLLIVAGTAAYLPARRASLVDPLVALRTQ